jgi:hypothetical protein
MTKKCDYLGCKKDATTFNKDKAYCRKHAEEKGLIGQTNFTNCLVKKNDI